MRCTKCGTMARVMEEHDGVHYAKCTCGKWMPLEITAGTARIIHRPRQADITLPRKGTKLYTCLTALASCHPANTGRVAIIAEHSSSDAASQLGVLQGRGLVDRLTEEKGSKGGSRWSLTETARKALNL